MSQSHGLASRLLLEKYSRSDCTEAINGTKVPEALGVRLHRLCTIRGIRYHPGFGRELMGLLPEFTRALNARSIMSGIIPETMTQEEQPYCIWHPQIASEDTYRQLAQQYPEMIYQVGRACAVADYTSLYHELDILPEVHIADEARDAANLTLYESITSKPVLYTIMDDYTCSINRLHPRVSDLNGNTCTNWMLEIKQAFHDVYGRHDEDSWMLSSRMRNGFEQQMFDITEDLNIDTDDTTDEYQRKLRPRCDLVKLLTEPLPRHLPTVDKDLLILMAAYYGDIDRYARLRRPVKLLREEQCCMRGIYYNTMFAVWWSKQEIPATSSGDIIRMAIDARFIMNNILSRVPKPSFKAPYLIWYPTLAQGTTYERLAELRPDMLPQILRSCIVGRYFTLFEQLLVKSLPDEAVLAEAVACTDLRFKAALEERIQQVGLVTLDTSERWKVSASISELQRSSTYVPKYSDFLGVHGDFEQLYNGYQCDASDVELSVCLPATWRPAEDDSEWVRWLDYVSWPPVNTVSS